MAQRIVFLPSGDGSNSLFTEKLIQFEWVPGMAISQAKKSVRNLHQAAEEQLGISRILEISTRSEIELGLTLSAFNLRVPYGTDIFSIESIYQSSKVFQFGGPFNDLAFESSLKAKQDTRLKNSGQLVGFNYEGQVWPISKSPNFYDYLYIKGLIFNGLQDSIAQFEGFTDIAFSQTTLNFQKGKSYNCQARSAAIFLTLARTNSIEKIVGNLKKMALQAPQEVEQLGLF